MAAHALTIALDMLRSLDGESPNLGHIEHGLGYAPGWDATLGFNDPQGASYADMVGYTQSGDVTSLRAALLAWVAILEPVLRHFHSYEEYRAACSEYIRHNKPHWRKRNWKWFAGQAPLPTEDRAPHYRKETA